MCPHPMHDGQRCPSVLQAVRKILTSIDGAPLQQLHLGSALGAISQIHSQPTPCSFSHLTRLDIGDSTFKGCKQDTFFEEGAIRFIEVQALAVHVLVMHLSDECHEAGPLS